ncbi:MAG: glycogen synthase GlgA [Defluviitaleaceae bacterium]|nr:glycogen synthase GlgA [Defluviitaleaceae bacterium]
MTDLKVLIAASEVSPYVKSGGLGDVAGSLPKALREHGVDARVVLPKYNAIRGKYLENAKHISSFPIQLSWRNPEASIHELAGDIPTYLIGNDYYFDRGDLYGYHDDYERFSFFSKAAIEFLNHIEFIPDIIHFNDWQTGLGCVHLRDIYSRYLPLSGVKSLFTIHNIQYQGTFGRDILPDVGLDMSYAADDKLEFYHQISFLKGGLIYSDAISTVSEAYMQEIQTPFYGYGLDGVLRGQRDKLYGILNGIDYGANDPKTAAIAENYSVKSLKGKKTCKRALQRKLNLAETDAPMIGIVTRLADQKGIDLIAVAFEELLSMDIQLVLLGTGEERYEHMFRQMAWRAPDRISANIFFDDDLARDIYAGADIFLMPSLFEPCGLGQMFAMRYGTIPVVRHTGGLADTVTHFDPGTKTGNGFVFQDYDANGMMWALRRAVDVYGSGSWQKLVKNAMNCDFSWAKSAEKYIDLYERLKSI